MASGKHRVSAILAASLLAAACVAVPAIAEPGSADRNATAIASTVRVLAMQADGTAKYGTGWVIVPTDNENRAGAAVVITAKHILVRAQRIVVVESGAAISDQKPATVIAASSEQDVAFLEVKDLSKPALQLTRARPNVGDDIFAAGYTNASDKGEAEGRARSASLKKGGLSKYFRGKSDDSAQAPVDQVEFDAPVQAGFSGGPVLNSCGRVIGLTLSDGGHIPLGENANVAIAQGVASGVAADEIVRAARSASINVTASESACPTVGTPPPPPICKAAFTTTDESGAPCTPIEPTPWQKFVHKLSGPAGIVLAIAILAVLIVIIGVIFWLLRRRSTGSVIIGSQPIDAMQGGSRLSDSGGSKSSQTGGGSGIGGRTLRLNGRGPGGEPIELRYSADQLAMTSVMLGVEGDSNGRIPDHRSKTLVSRQHARLGFDGRNFTITDNKSTNRTVVGKEVLEPFAKRTIVSGDTVTLADVLLNVTIE